MILFLLLGSLERQIVGNAGFFWAKPDILVLSGELGNRLDFSGRASLDVRVAYWDIARGDLNGVGHGVFLSRAVLELSPGPVSLRMGRQSVSYGDGLFLTDLGMGSDGALLSARAGLLRADAFWFIRSDSVMPGYPPDKALAGSYLSVGPGWWSVELYGGSETQSRPDRWMGARGFFERHAFTLKAEAAINRGGRAYLAEGAFWGLGSVEMGAGFFAFSEAWRSPFSYPYILDNYYNGWTGFGDAMTWSAMTDTLLAPHVSSCPGGAYGIYWPDINSLEVADMNLLLGLAPSLSARADAFVFWHLPGRENIGTEMSLNLFWDTQGFRFGLGGGYLSPGQFLKDLGRERSYWTLRAWCFKGFDLVPRVSGSSP